MEQMLNVHSIESFATLEGEGIRYAVFLQGCPYRCVYCHNPDTWYGGGRGSAKAIDEIVSQVKHYRSFYKKGGGVTVTGGEPLLQADGVLELFKQIHELELTNTIDTSCAVIPSNISELLKHTDLVIVDLKFHNNADYDKYAKGRLDNTIKMLDETLKAGVKVLIRTVVVPGINDTEKDIEKYVEIVNKYPNVTKYELLGYHTMGVYKYEQLGIHYPLEGVEALPATRLKELQKFANSKLKI